MARPCFDWVNKSLAAIRANPFFRRPPVLFAPFFCKFQCRAFSAGRTAIHFERITCGKQFSANYAWLFFFGLSPVYSFFVVIHVFASSAAENADTRAVRVVLNRLAAIRTIPRTELLRTHSSVIVRSLTAFAAIYLLAAVESKQLSALGTFGFFAQHWLVRFFVVVRAAAVFVAENPDARTVPIVLNRLAAIRAIPFAEFLRVLSDMILGAPARAAATELSSVGRLKYFSAKQTHFFFRHYAPPPRRHPVYHIMSN